LRAYYQAGGASGTITGLMLFASVRNELDAAIRSLRTGSRMPDADSRRDNFVSKHYLEEDSGLARKEDWCSGRPVAYSLYKQTRKAALDLAQDESARVRYDPEVDRGIFISDSYYERMFNAIEKLNVESEKELAHQASA
jgi:hypothetical protein